MPAALVQPRRALRMRLCSEEDIQELSALVLNTCEDANDADDFSSKGKEEFIATASADHMAARSQDLALKTTRYGVCTEEDTSLIGMSEMYVDVASDEKAAWKILYIYVVKSAHGQGVGKMLLKQCLTNVAPGGVVRLRSAPAAIPFYQHCGFQICGPPTEVETHGIRGSPLEMHIP